MVFPALQPAPQAAPLGAGPPPPPTFNTTNCPSFSPGSTSHPNAEEWLAINIQNGPEFPTAELNYINTISPKNPHLTNYPSPKSRVFNLVNGLLSRPAIMFDFRFGGAEGIEPLKTFACEREPS